MLVFILPKGHKDNIRTSGEVPIPSHKTFPFSDWCPFPGIYVHYLTHFDPATFIEQLLYVLGIVVGALEFQRG